jgi:LAO/AO transport system kinase
MAVHDTSGEAINPAFRHRSKPVRDLDYYVRGIHSGNRFILSEAITLLESRKALKRTLGIKILDEVHEPERNTVRIGITGTPGVGKSTFIEYFGGYLISHGHKVAVLAIDPSSQTCHGSILGDKTRMQTLSLKDDAYIRPTASGSVLGGTAAFTRDVMILCEAAGFDYIIVETVGVGQSETEVDTMVDVNILLLQPGAGDEIQGIKRGIAEKADIFIINKADGQQLPLARQTKISYAAAIRLFHHETPDWLCPVILSSSIEGTGFTEVYTSVTDYIKVLKEKDLFYSRRKLQDAVWYEKQAILLMQQILFTYSNFAALINEVKHDIGEGLITTTSGLSKTEEALRKVLHK